MYEFYKNNISLIAQNRIATVDINYDIYPLGKFGSYVVQGSHSIERLAFEDNGVSLYTLISFKRKIV